MCDVWCCRVVVRYVVVYCMVLCVVCCVLCVVCCVLCVVCCVLCVVVCVEEGWCGEGRGEERVRKVAILVVWAT